MAITIKTPEQIQKMRKAGQLVAKTHELLANMIEPGITTKELDVAAEKFIRSCGAIPSFLGYNGYPASICASINEEVIHGIPAKRKIKDGDVVSIDIGAYIDGFHGDAARTHGVGNVSEEARKLIEVTEQSFFEGIKFAKNGNHLHEISAAIQDYVEKFGFSVVRNYCGHGIGKQMHEDPQIVNYRQKKRGPRLQSGMTLAIEPMVNCGTFEVTVLGDGWTVVTNDKKYSAHYENTLLVTDGEPELLTLLR